MDHISNESMKAYLLGQLPEDQAAVLEEKYFTNREFFLQVQSAETALISDYLDGNLPSAEKQRFESRYLQVPLLQSKVEEARRQRAAQPSTAHATIWPRLRLVVGIAAVLTLTLGLWFYRSRFANLPGAGAMQPQALSVMAIHLTSGQKKGPGEQQAQFEPPARNAAINLVMELPAQSSPVQCQVRIYRVNADGGRTTMWNSPGPILSSREDNAQVLTLQISGSLLEPGDYIAEAWTAGGEIQETYPYRIRKS
jgi:anti-sigma factor RsiW